MFRPLQVLSACTAALAHGGNDVGNAIGPVVLLWIVFQVIFIQLEKKLILTVKFQKPIGYFTDSIPMWILAFGGLGISLGLGMFGKRVIMTMGSESTGKMTSSRGFCVEWIAAVTVLIASLREIAIPVSTTHCQIGGVVGAEIPRIKKVT